jgi:hypothetical protein
MRFGFPWRKPKPERDGDSEDSELTPAPRDLLRKLKADGCLCYRSLGPNGVFWNVTTDDGREYSVSGADDWECAIRMAVTLHMQFMHLPGTKGQDR